jgi:hypothetical protein
MVSAIASRAFLYNRDDLIQGFESLGYELIDSWQIAESVHSVMVPFYPDRSVTAYSGLFLRLWRAPESRINFSWKAKPDFGPNAECDLRELGGHSGRANAQMRLAGA